MSVPATVPPPVDRAAAQPAALVDVAGCGSPRLRALALALQGRPVAVLGTRPDAERAALHGLRVTGACAPPLGDPRRARRPLLAALGGPRRLGALIAHGARAVEAARLAGIRAEPMQGPLPGPLAPLDADALRASWGAGPADLVCLLLASPPAAGDARLALDIAGRAGMIGGRVVLVAHPGAGAVEHARRFADAAGDAWCMVTDERVEEPEWMAAGADAALALPADPGPAGDPLCVELALRAGLPVVASADAPGSGLVDAARRFDRRRPNVAAQLLRAAAAPRLSRRA
jgi:hypothetical protein